MGAAPPEPSLRERRLLEAAREGDQEAYGRLVEPHRSELHAHCYRMLGSVHDAEDALQDGLLRAWRGLARFEGRSSLRTWLYRIATNACLDLIARRPKRVLPIDSVEAGEPLVGSVWVEPYPDGRLGLEDGFAAPEARYERRESVELAFIAALQHLPANQRATLILREVLGFSAREVAESLETTVASVNSTLQRARKAVDRRLPDQSQQATLRSLGDARVRELVERYVDAWERGDADAVAALLAEDATFSMPPAPTWFRGRDAIREFLPRGPLSIRRRFLPIRANGQLAFGTYRWDAEREGYVGNAVHLLTLRGSEVGEITAFLTPEAFPAFGLPDEPSGQPDPRRSLFADLEAAVLESPGALPAAARRALALGDLDGLSEGAAAYLAKVEGPSYATTDREVAALAGELGEEAVFEATIAVAFGAARRQLQVALALLEERR